MEAFISSLENMKQKCVLQDPSYWDVVLEEGETPLETQDRSSVRVRTKEGFTIRLRFMDMKPYMCCINGYVSLPRGLHLESWIQENPSYDEMNYYVPVPAELTYFELDALEYGWDHAHAYDANLGVPLHQQPQKQVSGPVQVLEEARSFIRGIMTKENEIVQRKKQEQMEVLREDLMKEALHPRRVEAWVGQEFDPFE